MLGNVPFAELITFTRASPAWRFNASGILVQDGSNVPRFDYDPVTLQPRGLLIEEARTNLVTRSAEFDHASWTKTNMSVTANAMVGPDGTASAEKLIPTTTSGTHGVNISTSTVSASSMYFWSVFAKAGEVQEHPPARRGLGQFPGGHDRRPHYRRHFEPVSQCDCAGSPEWLVLAHVGHDNWRGAHEHHAWSLGVRQHRSVHLCGGRY